MPVWMIYTEFLSALKFHSFQRGKPKTNNHPPFDQIRVFKIILQLEGYGMAFATLLILSSDNNAIVVSPLVR